MVAVHNKHMPAPITVHTCRTVALSDPAWPVTALVSGSNGSVGAAMVGVAGGGFGKYDSPFHPMNAS